MSWLCTPVVMSIFIELKEISIELDLIFSNKERLCLVLILLFFCIKYFY